ncbi:DUF3606 domain-containing protein [Novosphingobium sp. Rr 2-17]|uniref:DUF3606 domain-containing protein n=1 Tax=Novosphingobium sp. Rr 2-17 TaxID=555793 RepID=UPI001ED905AE|nr:DUF3606 domain-containing protein [Novosphingobium sp. Rr 2-17]
MSGCEAYEVDYFAEKHGLTRDQAQALIDRVGNDRDKLDAEAEKVTKKWEGGAAPAAHQRSRFLWRQRTGNNPKLRQSLAIGPPR